MLQNFLLTTYDETRPRILRWAYDSAALAKAIAFTAEPMVLAGEGAMDLINRLQAPFGTGPMVSSDLL
jgi:hypothetical protein